MILINYLKPNIVIYADKLISGDLTIYNEYEQRIMQQEIVSQSIINILIGINMGTKIKVILKTDKQFIQKTFTINNN